MNRALIAAAALLLLVVVSAILHPDLLHVIPDTLHVIADLAVVLAVLIGSLEYFRHGDERRDETKAIDDHIRALATQASLQIQQERQGQDVKTLLRRLTMRGSTPGDLMATWLTTMASEAPQASSDLRREAREVVRVFFAMAIVTKERDERGTMDTNDPDLNARLKRLDDLLKGLRVKP
ncbi:MAG: hypothetical protein DMD38_10090 [Gemmatimonadetes bacterium]|nr:MAG: hypothetical protein AUI09_03430 [Gemmatimonadetes bacterium 13_2_20CM_2_66_5]OLD88913.1 MAG: hypothetical protein AUG85_03300 [Gemmatimonadetes bacterium 13_1_20CM_4_66_11]PYP96053.1 MAG: hypothetical protein DMD38_10090 [Gemmatimonadota bacterium]